MVILSIETTGKLASAAVYKDGSVSCVLGENEMSHLSEIAAMIDSLMTREEIKPESLDAIAVSCGPGSFTGIRIGMATAKGLAQVWDKPIVEVPTLESFAYANIPYTNNTLICPLFDARRSQVYAAAFRKQVYTGGCCMTGSEPREEVRTIIPEGAYALEEYLRLVEDAVWDGDTVLLMGDGSRKFEEQIREYLGEPCCGAGPSFEIDFADDAHYLQRADSVALLGVKLFKEGSCKDCFTAKPNYLRAAEPDRKKAEKEKNG